MTKDKTQDEIINIDTIKERIYIIRGKKVMLDRDLAILYEVPTMVLNQSVRRNLDRFPDDFMFQLTSEEMKDIFRSQSAIIKDDQNINLKSQFGTSSHGGSRKLPLAFTEQGIAMLSSVLNSKRAIQVNIQIIRIFTKLREMIDTYKELREKVEEMEKNNERDFKEIFRIIKLILKQEEKPKRKIGFHIK